MRGWDPALSTWPNRDDGRSVEDTAEALGYNHINPYLNDLETKEGRADMRRRFEALTAEWRAKHPLKGAAS